MPVDITPGNLFDSFVLHVLGEPKEEKVDTVLALVSVTITPQGSGSQGHNVSIDFTYLTGDPPATAFDVSWASDNPEAVLPTLWTFTPTRPQRTGDPNEVRVARLLAFVPNPNKRTRFVATIISRQE